VSHRKCGKRIINKNMNVCSAPICCTFALYCRCKAATAVFNLYRITWTNLNSQNKLRGDVQCESPSKFFIWKTNSLFSEQKEDSHHQVQPCAPTHVQTFNTYGNRIFPLLDQENYETSLKKYSM
jgi:hypothetical protein